MKDVQQEITLLSQLAQADAQNVTKYYGSFLNGSKLWIIMEYCSGGSVRTLLKAGKIEEKYSAVIVRELLVALQYIHREGIIHRDIKAANVLVTKEGRVQLCDFGVAAQLSSVQLKRTSMIGTPYWMAPEVIQEGAAYNQKADVWSLGVTLYEIATGSPPWSDQEVKRAVYLIPRSKPARLEGTQYSAALKEFVAKCLDEQPDERATAEELSKTRFIKMTRNVPTVIIRDLIVRYTIWRENNKGARDSFLLPNNGGADIASDDEDDTETPEFWDFDDTATPQTSHYSPNSFQFSGATGTAGASNVPGSRMGTLMAGAELNSAFSTSKITNTAGPDTYRVGETGIAASATATIEKHPLMELFITESDASDPLTPPVTLSTNPSSVSLSGMAPRSEYSSPMISLDIPPAQPYAPVEIEIPSFDALDSHPMINPSTASGFPLPISGLAPVSSASTSNLLDLAGGQSRLGMISSASSTVTPHTPIKPVFSQTNLNLYNSSPIPLPTGNLPSSSLQKLTPHNTSKPATRRTPSPKRGAKQVKSSPKTTGGHQTSRSISSRITTQRTLNSHSSTDSTSTTDVEDLQSSFDFSNTNTHAFEKLRTLSQSSSSASLEGLDKMNFHGQLEMTTNTLSKQPNSNSTGNRQNLFLAMPPAPLLGQQQPIALQPPPNFNIFNDGSQAVGSAHSTEAKEANPLLSQQQLLYNQQLMQQQQKQGPSALSQVPTSSTASERVPRTLTTQKQFKQKQLQKHKQPPKDIFKSQQRQVVSPVITGPRLFPKLVPLDSNVMLDSTSKEDSVAHFDVLLASLISSLDAIEQDLSTNYL